MFLYRIYQILVMLPIMLVVTIIAALVTIAGSALGAARWWGYYPQIIWARLFCWLNFVTVSVVGHENIRKNTSYVFVANHQGAFDIFAIYGWLGHNFRWMMKKSLEKIPLVGFSCRISGQIYVDNSSPSAIRETMADAEHQLQKGMSVVVFPEGSRTFTGAVGRFKRGAYTLAVEFRLPIVPVTIDGAFRVMPRPAMMPRPGHIRLTIHRPIEATADGHDLQAVMESSRTAILSALPPEQFLH